jgi:hypothetical protein
VDWGVAEQAPDAVVMLFAFPGQLHDFAARTQDAAFYHAFHVIKRLDTVHLGGTPPRRRNGTRSATTPIRAITNPGIS